MTADTPSYHLVRFYHNSDWEIALCTERGWYRAGYGYVCNKPEHIHSRIDIEGPIHLPPIATAPEVLICMVESCHKNKSLVSLGQYRCYNDNCPHMPSEESLDAAHTDQ